MKKGIALLITMGFIAILVSLIAYMLSMSDGVLKRSDILEQRNQSTSLYRDIKVIVDRFIKDVKDSEDLDYFLSEASYISYQNSNLSFSMEVYPLSNKLNINSILIGEKVDANMVDFLKRVSIKYNILDIGFLTNLILDTIDKDDSPREIGSEISQQSVKFSNSAIHNYRHFQTILRYYADNREDDHVFDVPWKKLIFFGGADKTTLDCDRLDSSLVEILGFGTDSYSGCADLNGSVEDVELSKKYSIKEYTKGDNYYILVKIVQAIETLKESASFIYNLKTGEVSRVELFYN